MENGMVGLVLLQINPATKIGLKNKIADYR
jgi:hypothetical protein